VKRLAQLDLKKWFLQVDRPPIILRGARQVGKTTLVRQFCHDEKIELFEINLEYKKLNCLKQNVNSSDPINVSVEDIIDEIELSLKRKLTKNSLIFFDEIQEEPKLINLLRYFYELKPELNIIAAGSLLEWAIKEGNYSFPVGRVIFYHLGPMTFCEFLLSMNEDSLVQKIQEKKITSTVHEKSLGYLKKYFYLGGMPKVLLKYQQTGSLLEAREIQEQILQTYVADFPKYNKRINLIRMERIFNGMSLYIGKKNIYQNYDEASKSREIKRVIDLFIDAKIIYPAYHSEASGVPLQATNDLSIFKLYFIDIGLLNAIHKLSFETLDADFKLNLVTKGLLAEQFVAQHLNFINGSKLSPQLNYWLRDKGSQKGEIDFLVEDKGKIWPIEVKAGSSRQMKSLFYFSKEKKINEAILFSLMDQNMLTKINEFEELNHKIEGKEVGIKLRHLPMYVVEKLILYLNS
jgi:predicted AAA+ superfamily ATPase